MDTEEIARTVMWEQGPVTIERHVKPYDFPTVYVCLNGEPIPEQRLGDFPEMVKQAQALIERRAFFADVLSTAVEGGIGYWCQIESWNKADTEDRTKVKIVAWADEAPGESDGLEGEPELPITVGLDDIERAFDLILSGVEPDERDRVFGMHKSYVQDFRSARSSLDAGDIDAEMADMAVQIAALGLVVFG